MLRRAAGLAVQHSGRSTAVSNGINTRNIGSRLFCSTHGGGDDRDTTLNTLLGKLTDSGFTPGQVESVSTFVREQEERGKTELVTDFMGSLDKLVDVAGRKRSSLSRGREIRHIRLKHLKRTRDLRARRGQEGGEIGIPQGALVSLQLLEDMRNRGEHDPALYGLAVVAFAEAGLTKQAFDLVTQSKEVGALPDSKALQSLAMACESRLEKMAVSAAAPAAGEGDIYDEESDPEGSKENECEKSSDTVGGMGRVVKPGDNGGRVIMELNEGINNPEHEREMADVIRQLIGEK